MSRKSPEYHRFSEFGRPIRSEKPFLQGLKLKPKAIKAEIEADIRPTFRSKPMTASKPFATGGIMTTDGGTMYPSTWWSGSSPITSTSTSTSGSIVYKGTSWPTVGTWTTTTPWTLVYDEYDPLSPEQQKMVQDVILEEIRKNELWGPFKPR